MGCSRGPRPAALHACVWYPGMLSLVPGPCPPPPQHPHSFAPATCPTHAPHAPGHWRRALAKRHAAEAPTKLTAAPLCPAQPGRRRTNQLGSTVPSNLRKRGAAHMQQQCGSQVLKGQQPAAKQPRVVA